MLCYPLMRSAILLLMLSCGTGPKDESTDSGESVSGAEGEGEGEGESDCVDPADPDNDGLDNCAEAEGGTDPNNEDSDGDGFSDGEEVDCGSDPNDPEEQCPDCGWSKNDPGDLISTGNQVGDVIANLTFVDQCEEVVSLWDFAGEYHILWMTATW